MKAGRAPCCSLAITESISLERGRLELLMSMIYDDL